MSMIEAQVESVVDELDPADIPDPVGWRILVEPVRVKEQTAGGIILSEQTKKNEAYLRYIGRVIAMGPLCYQHPKFEGSEPWCKVGDWVVFAYHTGQPIMVQTPNATVELKLVNDDEIRAVLRNPMSVLTYV